ncbi:hypothetical protein VCHA43P273_10190 [Vibrio chagasii]|nr:hypothetical protein VCHA43P273_10190 [Vibrio chagasii]
MLQTRSSSGINDSLIQTELETSDIEKATRLSGFLFGFLSLLALGYRY